MGLTILSNGVVKSNDENDKGKTLQINSKDYYVVTDLSDLQSKLLEHFNEFNDNTITPKVKLEPKYLVTSHVESFDRLFYSLRTTNWNFDVSTWDTSNVTNMNGTFMLLYSFNQDISNWDTSKVTDMGGMFYYAIAFNQDISKFTFNKVKNMSYFMYNCNNFNFGTTSQNDITEMVFENCDNFFNCFFNCSNLKKIPKINIDNSISIAIDIENLFTGTSLNKKDIFTFLTKILDGRQLYYNYSYISILLDEVSEYILGNKLSGTLNLIEFTNTDGITDISKLNEIYSNDLKKFNFNLIKDISSYYDLLEKNTDSANDLRNNILNKLKPIIESFYNQGNQGDPIKFEWSDLSVKGSNNIDLENLWKYGLNKLAGALYRLSQS